MDKLRLLIATTLFGMLLAACSTADSDLSSRLDAQSDRIADLEVQLSEKESGEMEGEHEEGKASAFEVAVAQYIMDTAGFHGIDEALSETGEIDPSSISRVVGVMRVVAGTSWPEELAEEGGHLEEMLMEFQTALLDDDAEAAAPLAGMVHDHQHDFSASISAWLSGEMPMDEEHDHSEDEGEASTEDDHDHADHEEMSEEEMAALHGVPEDASAIPNPFTGDEESTALGADLFLANCATCHGETGAGDGPAAADFEKPPADLSLPHVQGLSDGALFYIITNGLPETQMPPWEDVLEEDGRWAIVNFLRTFKESTE